MNNIARKKIEGFTLMEILIVIAVLAVLMKLISSGGIAAQKKSRIYQAKTMIASLETALAIYHVDFGAHPVSGNQNLVNLLADAATYSASDDWHGPYIAFKEKDLSASIPNAVLRDPWGKDFHYNYNPGSIPEYKIWSDGPDKQDDNGLDDDIISW
ncbi:MAG: type II secretion system protein GspG [Candidatus Omnitrophica bacterium]|nr:type II secretion system protein GspG [Candidatus Omnitrophota bacterium]